ncbi:MAG: hypothetical protein H7308_20080 [Chthonomonadaceae bacterium]|nr:hypothetical protein [Chthonomonadaceae bacterium]
MTCTEKSAAYDYRDTLSFEKTKNACFIHEMQERGIQLIGRGLWYLSGAHTEADIERAADTACDVLRTMKEETP